ncbi:MAG: ABC transporter ATP-binding protein [Spirochaetaceae bacterium]|nr:ABC transporter ATP-binding protein [Spirochaetaceae bacterium]
MNEKISCNTAQVFSSSKERELVQVKELSAWYGKHQVLENISFSMKAGDFICLSGPNGCGKSTLMTVLAGLGRHKLTTTGSIQLEGCHLNQLKSKQRAKIISYMSQAEANLWNFTVQDVILTGRYCHTGFTGIYSQQDRDIAQQAANQLQLKHLLNRRIHSLSGGEFQRVRIARSFCQQPKVLLLDEPAANLDLALRHDLLQATKELAQQQGTAVLMSIHDINLAAAFAQTLALLRPWHSLRENQTHAPQLLLGRPQQVMTPENLQQVYNRNFQIFTHPIHGCPAVWVE